MTDPPGKEGREAEYVSVESRHGRAVIVGRSAIGTVGRVIIVAIVATVVGLSQGWI